MGCDLVVSLGQAVAGGRTAFGLNRSQAGSACQPLRRAPGRTFALGEKVRTTYLEIPQTRQTFTVLGSQPVGSWGFDAGLNEHQLLAGRAPLRPTLVCAVAALTGPDLVRLVLERCRGARQALDLLSDLIARHGQGAFPGAAAADRCDNVFLLADAREAFAVEAAGNYWVYQEVRQVRAASGVRVIRQDWDGIARGLSSLAITRGWWPEDGSKLDFAGALGDQTTEHVAELHRWGRATLLLEQQNGRIDLGFVRRVLADHYEDSWGESDPWEARDTRPLCRHAKAEGAEATVASFLAEATGALTHVPLAWCAFGPPCCSVYFPVFLDGELPDAYLSAGTAGLAGRARRLVEDLGHDPDLWKRARGPISQLQARIDQEAAEFTGEAAALKVRGALADLRRLTTVFMEHNAECFEETLAQLEHELHSVELAHW